MSPLDDLLDEGVRTGVFPLCAAEVWQDGALRYQGGNAPGHAWFDLASLTKVVSTTAVFLALAKAGRVRPDDPLQRHLPGAAAKATLADLAFHRAGLPAFVPYFEQEMNRVPALFDEECDAAVRAQVRARVVERALATPQEAPVGERAVYSDVGFILLGEALAAAGGVPLDALFEAQVAGPLGLAAGYRRLSARRPLPTFVVPTGRQRPREPAPGQEGLWDVEQHRGRPGEVDDDNAWVLDGVSGHAGLFGTAAAVARFGRAILDGELVPPAAWTKDAATPGSTRAFGFDTPGTEAPSCGPRFGARPPGAIGHLGFTGTSLWVDLGRRLVVVLLTNRVAGPKGRADVRIREFRPRFHEAVLDALDVA